MVENKTAFATALELWAQSRERAISEVSKKAAGLAGQGRNHEAEYFRFVGRLLTIRAMHERAIASALRQTPEDAAVVVPQVSAGCEPS
jgi:hypothetical protein